VRANKPVKVGPFAAALKEALSPRGSATAPASTPSADDTTAAKSAPLRILLGEDNVVNQKVALAMLDRLGHRTDVAANGLEVLAALQRQRYDVLLLDVQMPEMDGLEAARLIREQWPEDVRPRVIGMTALAMDGDRERCLEAGMDDYVAKPIRDEDLRRALSACPARGAPVIRLAPTVDLNVLAQLRELQEPGAPDFVTELVDQFLLDVPDQLDQLESAARSQDAKRLERVAHSLKSSCMNLGAGEMSRQCAAIELAGRAGTLDGAVDHCLALRAEFERVEPQLRAERKVA
jgi:CheY-like chemotaxis protein/HPt (histidine-containing phosphotransfer) domain-containing protein